MFSNKSPEEKTLLAKMPKQKHCVKSVQIRSFSGSLSSEYGYLKRYLMKSSSFSKLLLFGLAESRYQLTLTSLGFFNIK